MRFLSAFSSIISTRQSLCRFFPFWWEKSNETLILRDNFWCRCHFYYELQWSWYCFYGALCVRWLLCRYQTDKYVDDATHKLIHIFLHARAVIIIMERPKKKIHRHKMKTLKDQQNKDIFSYVRMIIMFLCSSSVCLCRLSRWLSFYLNPVSVADPIVFVVHGYRWFLSLDGWYGENIVLPLRKMCLQWKETTADNYLLWTH